MLDTAPGFGLRGLVERAQSLGGWAEINSAPGRGTTVMLSVPLCAPAAASAPAGGPADEAETG
jgi:glucose-6-phosphate-specific signal transduction histidine kinase